MNEQPSLEELNALARRARREIVVAVAHAKGGHVGGPLSAVDLLTALYFRVLCIRPDEPDWPERDRFILSKGHCSIALYAVLALRGYFPVEELTSFDAIDSRLQGHPDMMALPGLDMSTGSLGLGLGAGVGIALGAKLSGQQFTTFVMVGDGASDLETRPAVDLFVGFGGFVARERIRREAAAFVTSLASVPALV